jgi:HSF-type DNA-binding
MELNGSLREHHPEVRDEDASHAAVRRAASADGPEDIKHSGDTGALENGSDPRQRVEQTFPNKLHYMLEQGLEELERDVIAWQPHGRAFLVLDQRRFVADLLPNWFRQNKYQSFQVGRVH